MKNLNNIKHLFLALKVATNEQTNEFWLGTNNDHYNRLCVAKSLFPNLLVKRDYKMDEEEEEEEGAINDYYLVGEDITHAYKILLNHLNHDGEISPTAFVGFGSMM